MILDTKGVARMFSVKRSTVHQWRRRGIILKPSGFVSGAPYWNRDKLVLWGCLTGRPFDVKATESTEGAIEP